MISSYPQLLAPLDLGFAPNAASGIMAGAAGKVGDGLARTTCWARRLLLQKRGVRMLSGIAATPIGGAGVVDAERAIGQGAQVAMGL